MLSRNDFIINVLEVFDTSRDVFWGQNRLPENYGQSFDDINLGFVFPTNDLNDCPGVNIDVTDNRDCFKTENDELCLDPFRTDICSEECRPGKTAGTAPVGHGYMSDLDVMCPPEVILTFVVDETCPQTAQFNVCLTQRLQLCWSNAKYPCDSGGPCESVGCDSEPYCTKIKDCPPSVNCGSKVCPPEPNWKTLENRGCITKKQELCSPWGDTIWTGLPKTENGYFCARSVSNWFCLGTVESVKGHYCGDAQSNSPGYDPDCYNTDV